MCEYCGCQQSISALAELTAEHDAVVELCGRAATAARAGRLDAAAHHARLIAAVLGPHTTVEEHGLFPALAGAFPDHVAALEEEHRRIEAVLKEANTATPTDPRWPHRLIAVLDLLREHILKEQDGVFPAALANLDTADWDHLDTVRMHAGSALHSSRT